MLNQQERTRPKACSQERFTTSGVTVHKCQERPLQLDDTNQRIGRMQLTIIILDDRVLAGGQSGIIFYRTDRAWPASTDQGFARASVSTSAAMRVHSK